MSASTLVLTFFLTFLALGWALVGLIAAEADIKWLAAYFVFTGLVGTVIVLLNQPAKPQRR